MESSGRTGGRMRTFKGKTKQGDKWYGDLGAMRFPGVDGQPIINKVLHSILDFTSAFLLRSLNC